MKITIILLAALCASVSLAQSPLAPDGNHLMTKGGVTYVTNSATADPTAELTKERDALKTQVADLTKQVESSNQIVAMLQEQRAFWNKTASDLEIQLRLVRNIADELQRNNAKELQREQDGAKKSPPLPEEKKPAAKK